MGENKKNFLEEPIHTYLFLIHEFHIWNIALDRFLPVCVFLGSATGP